jgi:hypothetical protein
MTVLRSRSAAEADAFEHADYDLEFRRMLKPVGTVSSVAVAASIAPLAGPRSKVADLAYIILTTTGWLVGNLLGILGCVVAMFIVISHGHIDIFFLHLDNLASRYNAADVGRRAAFDHQLVQVFVVGLGLTLAVRGPLFVTRLRRTLREGQGA